MNPHHPAFQVRQLGALVALFAVLVAGCVGDDRCTVGPPLEPRPCPSLVAIGDNTKLADLRPRWRPGGAAEIAFIHVASGGEWPPGDEEQQVWRTEVPSGERRFECAGSEVCWSRSGRQLAVVRADERGVDQLWIRDLDTSSERPITSSDDSGDTSTVSACWSPGDTAIVCERRRPRDDTGSIWIHSLTSGTWRRIGSGFSPKWSPTGNMLAYGPTLTIRSLGQGDSVLIIPTLRAVRVLEWSEDGRRIYCSAAEDGYRSIYEVRPEGPIVTLRSPGIMHATYSADMERYVFVGSLLSADSTVLLYHDPRTGCVPLR
ncbi:MAG: hypothetical protein IPK72_08545 [Candidatus Eisenbacteria bacterium]|nr:hypothetical protein [Candidatus Eisenbacteria bacterium]